ncbi:MAG: methylated-DNA--[protein]-cysteine S-methyltransferase [Burkholderiaceae bacterium]
MTPLVYGSLQSPLGPLWVSRSRRGVSGLYMSPSPTPGGFRSRRGSQPRVEDHWIRDDAAFADLAGQLDEYFSGCRSTFSIPLELSGTPFQLEVWSALCDIAYGETISYGTLAKRLSRPDAVRAVGAANGRNPVSILVPCHRVIGADGSLTGYGGGLQNKKFLLELESGQGRLA